MVSPVETNPAGFHDWQALHALLASSFAFMDGRINPPSSLASLSPEDFSAKARHEDLFIIRDAFLVACLFGTPQGDVYYIGKLAVAGAHRGRGHARALIDAAAARASQLGLSALELQTRVELVENHATFAAMGFSPSGATAHPGYDRPTSLTFRRPLQGFPPRG